MLDLCLDSSILFALWNGEESALAVGQMLNREQKRFHFVISSVVWVELHAHPNLESDSLELALSGLRIRHDAGLNVMVFKDCALAYRKYLMRRRKSGGGEAKQLLADFLIGSHAMHRNKHLMTLDPARYEKDFPELILLNPNQQSA